MNFSRLIQAANKAIAAGESCVLCTVVRLRGSGYGRPGARLLLTESGQREGYISGGCLEKDLCRRVWPETKNGPKLIAFDTRGNAVSASRYNTGCEGVVSILCQRVDLANSFAVDVLDLADRSGSEQRLLTVYRSESDLFRIGDSWLQPTELDLPQAVLRRFYQAKRNSSIEFNDDDGSRVEAAIEVLSPTRRLVIFGAGDDVVPVVQLANYQGWQTTVVCSRAELADPKRFPGAEVLCQPMAEAAASLPGLDRSDVVVMTHDFNRDAKLLPVVIQRNARSIGLLGPKRRLGRLIQSIYKSGLSLNDQQIQTIRSPIGLDIGAVTPEEIALSIVTELIAIQSGRLGGLLHERLAPINDPEQHLVERRIAETVPSKPACSK